MKMSLIQTKNGPSDFRTASSRLLVKELGEDGAIEGHGSVFGVVDSYKEIVATGAFKASLENHRKAGTFPKMLLQHDPKRPIGVYTEMREDEKGLFVRGRLNLDTVDGRETYSNLKMGALDGLSIGFMPVNSTIDEKTRVKTLTEIDLWEVSVVTFPAAKLARVEGVKAAIAEITRFADVERLLCDTGQFSRSEATAIVAKCKEIDRAHREDAEAKSALNASAARLLDLMKS